MEGYYRLTREFASATAKKDQIGKGLALDNMMGVRGKPQLNSGVSRVEQSLKVILSTPKGSRFFNPTFGSHLHNILFEQNVFSKKSMAKIYAEEAIRDWEPRVTTVSVTVEDAATIGRLGLNILFRIKGDEGAHALRYELTSEGGSAYGL